MPTAAPAPGSDTPAITASDRADTVLSPAAEAANEPTGMIACARCRASVPASHKFCFECGAPMVDGDAPLSSEGTQARARNPFHQANAGALAGGGSPMQSAANAPMAAATLAAPHAPPIAPGNSPRLNTLTTKPGNKTMFFGAMQTARAKLTIIRGDGHDGVSYSLAGQEHSFGRGAESALLFEDDPFLSPTHANFFYDAARQGALVVRDEGSKNGVFVRIRGTVPIAPGAQFLAGEQLFELAAGHSGELEFIDDGTYYFASPGPASGFRVIQRLRGGVVGAAYNVSAPTFTIGREGSDANFPSDPFISGRHAQVTSGPSGLELTDLNSKNGTFMKLRGEHVLHHGDYVFLGQQLIRIEIV